MGTFLAIVFFICIVVGLVLGVQKGNARAQHPSHCRHCGARLRLADDKVHRMPVCKKCGRTQ